MNHIADHRELTVADKISLTGQTFIAFGGFLLTMAALYQLVAEGKLADVRKHDFNRGGPSSEILDLLRNTLDPTSRF